ncbi:Ca(2+)-dependent cysteine protease [Gryganskiella cystojenkinii]|nr:Ca(2+)-dependent cysteine protease [Gryganskiella cystojenkinii]
MYPGHYQNPQQFAPPPGQHAPVVYRPPAYAAPQQPPPQQHQYAPPQQHPPPPPPPQAYPGYPPQYAPPASSPYAPPAATYPPPASPYPPPHAVASPYRPPAQVVGSPYPPAAPPVYGAPPPQHAPPPSPYGPPPAAPMRYQTAPYGAPPPAPIAYAPPQQFRPPAPVVPVYQQMYVPANVPPPPQGWAMHQHPQMMAPINFQLSNCQGRKRALFIGINYFGQKNELGGCINDVKNIKAFLIRQFGFRDEDTISLTDDARDPTRIPTKANIIAAMQWLVRDARPNDSFFFHYSGHGGQTPDLDGDEDDGFDETIYPVDHQRAGVIIDDTMHDIMVKPLPPGCRLTAIMDCCHSGSALDLPFTYSTTGQLKEDNVLGGLGKDVMNAGLSYLRGDVVGMFKNLGGMGQRVGGNREHQIRTKSSPADCIMFSGCKDTQTSVDAHEQGFGRTGAMTFSFIMALTANPRQSYLQLLNSIRDILRSKYEQKPQLSSSHPVDLNLLFTM